MPSPLYDIPIQTAAGESTTLAGLSDKVVLVVNVASRCGLTPQYADLQQLQTEYADRGFTVVGFPSNQFNGQEPGTDEEIQAFCSATFGVDFPVFAKIEVNGEGRHPLYELLTTVEDESGDAGDVAWNFEKFLIAPGGEVVSRLRPKTKPTDPAFVAKIEQYLPA
ncbi:MULTISPECIES: glutathione peroxidase [Subtercola]|uniref:Glutathione peroxidase n=1 Tax=Subtercola vilae TaxID=2056433 RepID=A0A4T2BUK1_9MICO|nr:MULTISPECIES: glutathione peroxidase [Subtercola]MEA9986489.1 glutathione peroxidase [Subtercola sp. RTI3]TIH33466.1 glutathione peroxidase [Subtercola vilae]